MDGISSRILDSQIYAPAESNWQPNKLLFQVDLAPHETRTYYILDASALAAVPPPIVKTFARYVPERYDDFAWESDRIAHRVYGLALIRRKAPSAAAPDVWIKKDRGLIVDTMYDTGITTRTTARSWTIIASATAAAAAGWASGTARNFTRPAITGTGAHHHRPDPLGI